MNHSDDDSISALSEYLGCFDNKKEYIYLGERYGYDLFSEDNGYNYITGGGGIVFNVKTLRKLVDSCSCASPSSPDDMIIASCLKSLDIDAIHSPLFHQARSKDYAPEVLYRDSISFHKFWQIEPLDVYERWFRKRDEEYHEINKHLLSDYKYLKSSCVTPSTTNVEKKINHNVKHVEL
jgi:UDP-glucose:O-linked fucose beta-1,3-glucosyltransferase